MSNISRRASYHLFNDSVSDETEENWRLEKRDSRGHDRNERRRGTSLGLLDFFCEILQLYRCLFRITL